MKIVFMGTPSAAVPALEKILSDGHEVAGVYTQPDRPAGRGNKIAVSPVKEVGLRNGLRIIQPTKLKTQEAIDEFRSLSADAAVVVAYGRILPVPFLEAFPMGAINVHFSLLPAYRGAAPVNWAIARGETETGVTTMQMDEGLDTGDILLQAEVSIGEDENSDELMERLSFLGADLLSRTLLSYDALVPRPQDDQLATYAPILTKADGLADWRLTAVELVRRIRGFQPFPGVYTFYRGQRLSIRRAVSETHAARTAGPGTIIEAKSDMLEIACGGGSALRILEIQPEGKRTMSARDYINGSRPVAGEYFESN